MKIGAKIKGLRKLKDMTLKELSKASGVAVATLCRIEKNKMLGTVKAHQAIASALGINLPQLYSDIDIEYKPVDFQSKGTRTDIFIHNVRASYDMLTNKVMSKKMMPVIMRLAPGGETSNEELPKQTEKFIYILRGVCKAYIGSKTYALRKGETLYFDASLRHRFKNVGKEETRAICVITPPAL